MSVSTMMIVLRTTIGSRTLVNFLWPWGVVLAVMVACIAFLLLGPGRRLTKIVRFPGLAAITVVGFGALAVMVLYALDGTPVRLW